MNRLLPVAAAGAETGTGTADGAPGALADWTSKLGDLDKLVDMRAGEREDCRWSLMIDGRTDGRTVPGSLLLSNLWPKGSRTACGCF